MMEAGWSARQVAHQLGHSDCVVRRYWDQWIREMSYTRSPGSGHPRHTSRQENHSIVRNSRVQTTASSAVIQAQVASSLGTPASSRTIRRRLAEGHLGSRRPLRVLPLHHPTNLPGAIFQQDNARPHTAIWLAVDLQSCFHSMTCHLRSYS
ncbi:HTH_Tnp_Tc3_2 domain-containing protein [Trichonephila clavipes]|nr:HTH_Tnp_Tc3_2 domain-containing protein [Trichonephila clavipes]